MSVKISAMTETTDISGTAHIESTVDGQTRKVTIKAATYTPTLTNIANVDGSTAYLTNYVRLANMVMVSGRIDIDPTAGATLTRVGVSLPVASNIENNFELTGTIHSSTINLGGAVFGDATNNRAEIQFLTSVTANTDFFFTFTYRII